MGSLRKNLIILNICFLAVLALAFFALPARAAAVDTSNLAYPIAELGDCSDQAACAVYCDKNENMLACVGYAEKNNLIDPAEANIAKKAIAKIQAKETPGGCDSEQSCQVYCQNNVIDLNSCIAFAEEIGIAPAEIEQAKKISKALQGGANMPGGCTGKASCEAYCQGADHADECLSFAEVAQILPAEEIAEAKKILPFLKSGQMPGGCKAKTECKAYCDQDEHFSECIKFAEQAGFVSQEEAELAKKTGGKGPGGCKSKRVCEDYCNLPENAAACKEFVLSHDLVDEKTAERLRNGHKEIQAGLEKIPAEVRPVVESCLNSLFNGNLSAVIAGKQDVTKAQGEGIGPCFEAAMKNYAAEQAQSGASSAQPSAPSGSPLPSMNPGVHSQPMDQSLENAPAEIREQVQAEIDRQRQQAMENAINQSMPASPPSDISLPTTQAPPANMTVPAQPPLIQGPPCNSPEECRIMFGGDGPPAGMP